MPEKENTDDQYVYLRAPARKVGAAMSVKAQAAVWEADLEPDTKLVLMAYADHADHNGENIFPSVGLIAWKVQMDERTVQRYTRKLVTRGILVEDGVSYLGTNLFHIDFAKLPAREAYRMRRRGRPKGPSSTNNGDTGDTHIPENNGDTGDTHLLGDEKMGDSGAGITVTESENNGDTALSYKPSFLNPSSLNHHDSVPPLRVGTTGGVKGSLDDLDAVTPTAPAAPSVQEKKAPAGKQVGGTKPAKTPAAAPATAAAVEAELAAMLACWKALFPAKAQPKTATHREKFSARYKNKEWRNTWRAALDKASRSKHLQGSGWFNFEWLVKNDDNIYKIINGVYDSFDEQIAAKDAKMQAARERAGGTPEARPAGAPQVGAWTDFTRDRLMQEYQTQQGAG